MNRFRTALRGCLSALMVARVLASTAAIAASPSGEVRLVAKVGAVEVLVAKSVPPNWVKVETNQDLFANWRLRPTPWLYGALLEEQLNRYNEGVRDLERSVALNDNRRLYRSE